MGKNISDDNRYEHGAVRSNAGMRIPVSGTEAAKQRSDAGAYTVCDIIDRMSVYCVVFVPKIYRQR